MSEDTGTNKKMKMMDLNDPPPCKDLDSDKSNPEIVDLTDIKEDAHTQKDADTQNDAATQNDADTQNDAAAGSQECSTSRWYHKRRLRENDIAFVKMQASKK